MSYFKAVLIAVDQLINAICGGWPDETLSSRAYRCRLAGNPTIANIIDFIFNIFGDINHCQVSFESERLDRQLPPELRNNVINYKI